MSLWFKFHCLSHPDRKPLICIYILDIDTIHKEHPISSNLISTLQKKAYPVKPVSLGDVMIILQVGGHWSDCIELMGGDGKMDIFNVGWINKQNIRLRVIFEG